MKFYLIILMISISHLSFSQLLKKKRFKIEINDKNIGLSQYDTLKTDLTFFSIFDDVIADKNKYNSNLNKNGLWFEKHNNRDSLELYLGQYHNGKKIGYWFSFTNYGEIKKLEFISNSKITDLTSKLYFEITEDKLPTEDGEGDTLKNILLTHFNIDSSIQCSIYGNNLMVSYSNLSEKRVFIFEEKKIKVIYELKSGYLNNSVYFINSFNKPSIDTKISAIINFRDGFLHGRSLIYGNFGEKNTLLFDKGVLISKDLMNKNNVLDYFLCSRNIFLCSFEIELQYYRLIEKNISDEYGGPKNILYNGFRGAKATYKDIKKISDYKKEKKMLKKKICNEYKNKSKSKRLQKRLLNDILFSYYFW